MKFFVMKPINGNVFPASFGPHSCILTFTLPSRLASKVDNSALAVNGMIQLNTDAPFFISNIRITQLFPYTVSKGSNAGVFTVSVVHVRSVACSAFSTSLYDVSIGLLSTIPSVVQMLKNLSSALLLILSIKPQNVSYLSGSARGSSGKYWCSILIARSFSACQIIICSAVL